MVERMGIKEWKKGAFKKIPESLRQGLCRMLLKKI
jgi:hypothetical protein